MPRASVRLSLALWFAVGPVALAAASKAASPVAPIGAAPLQRDTLPNGFRYAFLPRTTEPGRLSLRLIVHAGSLDEHGDERGFAHFVEHLAFNGTRHYPPGKLVSFFQRLGLAWGADANAETSFTSTIYKLDLPAGAASHVGEALQVLRDYADGIEFVPAEVRRERGVVLSELAARDTDALEVWSRTIAIDYAGTSLPGRMPLGDPASIKHAEAAALRGFYDRCYRPERMTLLVVGDIAPGPLQKLVEENFAPLRGRGAGAAQVLPTPLAQPGMAAHVVTDPLSPAARVTLVAIAPDGPATPAEAESVGGGGLVIGLLNRRLAERQAAMSHRIGHAAAFLVQGLDNRYLHYGLEADAKAADWPAALGLIENELRRARENGFTAGEVKEISAGLIAGVRANQADFAGRTDDRVANDIASVLAAGRDWHSPAWLLAIAENTLAHFTPAQAAERLRTILPDDRLQILLSTPTPPDGGAAAVLAAYRASAAQPLAAEPATPARDLRFPYNDFGPPGAVAERKTDAGLGLELVRFANGARLNLRPSTLEPQRFRLWARLGRGTADVPRDLPGINFLAIALLSRCDLGRLTREELGRLTGLHAVDGNWSFEDNNFFIQLTGPSDALPFALRSLTAYLADVKLDASKLPDAVSLYPGLTASFINSTSGRTKVEMIFRATGDDPRFRLPAQAEIAHYAYATVAAWLRTHWLDGPLEIGLAGDFNSDDAIAAAAASVGTLPSRGEPPSLPAERIARRAKFVRNLTYVDLPDKTADVRFFWPMRDAADPRVFRALALATTALQDRLRLKLRQELGVTYSPGSFVYRDDGQPDFGLAGVELTFAPARALKLAERTIKLAADFARHGLTKEEFTRLREPLRAAALANLQSNEWWLANVLTRAQSQPAVLDEARTHATAFDDLTRGEVNRLAASHFTAAEASAVGFIPRAAPAPKKP